MNFDLLLAWMAHVAEGPWAAFRRAITNLVQADADGADADEMTRRARRTLTDLGHADFFLDGGNSWRVIAPVLAGLPGGNEAVLCGARNAGLVGELEKAAVAAGCEVSSDDDFDAPRRVSFIGGAEALASVSRAARIPFVENLPRRLAASIVPVGRAIEMAEQDDPPINWGHSAFDFEELAWSTHAEGPTAHEYQSKYGVRRHFVDVPDRGLVEMDRRPAVYAAAFIRSVGLATYDAAQRQLFVPLAAPLPTPYARAATLCSGRPSTVSDGRACYGDVPPGIAAVLIVSSGGSYPTSPTLYRSGGRTR